MATTWIVIADSARARILSAETGDSELTKFKELTHPESRAHEMDLVTDEHGRVFDSRGKGRHAMSETVSPKEHEASKLCKELAREIEAGRTRGLFENLILVAPPDFLGKLRKSLTSSTIRMVTRDLNKNLTDMPVDGIREHLSAS